MTYTIKEVTQYLGKDEDKAWQVLHDITPFMIDQCPMGVYMPIPFTYDLWWPWLQNYFAATRMGFWEPETNLQYSWIDTEMKKSMGY